MKKRFYIFSQLVESARNYLEKKKGKHYKPIKHLSKKMAYRKWKEKSGIKTFGNFRPIKPFMYNGRAI